MSGITDELYSDFGDLIISEALTETYISKLYFSEEKRDS